ncbi:hypothetical protein QFZ82_004290 [Streptomyces sp. V4I23]|uniref:peptidoglycan-binding domain-containing protein n=1 Tax=Streptomyces sp. V4I23 TaxID=3042282 RepID=UPI00278484FE|nr:peptidoglycan-binding domain-containing protein [Streptomyces sp. V4I23]MDQ1009805.1 hypothetical protein [Streptomyces sp. V4I23]
MTRPTSLRMRLIAVTAAAVTALTGLDLANASSGNAADSAARADTAAPSTRDAAGRAAMNADPATRPQTTRQPVLRTGMQGPAVRSLQRLLTAHGHPTDVDGDFGPRTQAALIAFQHKAGLTADGIAGTRTWRALQTAATPTTAQPPAPAAPDTCWTSADSSTDYAYRCEFGIHPVSGRNSTALTRAMLTKATTDFSDHFPFKGCGQVLKEGQVCSLLPLNVQMVEAPVKVIDIGPDYFVLMSLPGHPEGEDRSIRFTIHVAGNQLRLGVHAWGKPSRSARASVDTGFVTHVWGTYAQQGLRSLIAPK